MVATSIDSLAIKLKNGASKVDLSAIHQPILQSTTVTSENVQVTQLR